MPLTEILTLLVFLFPLAYSPGPGNLFFAANGARFGFGAMISASLGYHLATWGVTCAIGLGFHEAATVHPRLAGAIRLIGSTYVLWLAISFLRAGSAAATDTPAPVHIPGFNAGAVLLLFNPKAYVIIALMFSQFQGADRDISTGTLPITTVFTLNNLVAFSLYTLAGDQLGRRLRSERDTRGLNVFFGLMLGMAAVWMAVAR